MTVEAEGDYPRDFAEPGGGPPLLQVAQEVFPLFEAEEEAQK